MADKIERSSGAVIGGAASVQENDNRLIDSLFEIVSIADFTARSQAKLFSLDTTNKRDEEKAGRIKGALSVTAETDRALRQEVTNMTGRSFSQMPEAVQHDFGCDMAEILFFMRHHPVIVLRSAQSEKAYHKRILRIEFSLRVEDNADSSYSASICIEDTDTGYRASSKDIALAVNEAAIVSLKKYLQCCERESTILPLAKALSDLRKTIAKCGRQQICESDLVYAILPRNGASSGFVVAGNSLLQEMRDRLVGVVKAYPEILRPYAARKRAK